MVTSYSEGRSSMISLIAAVDKKGGIGINNSMPWHIEEDFKWFRFHTMYKTVVMGSNTLFSIGSPLKGRDNIILSSSLAEVQNAKVFRSVTDVLAYTHRDREIMIIGGAHVYEQFIPYANRIYLTELDKEFECDTFFPSFDKNRYKHYFHREGTEELGFKYSFNVYKLTEG